MSSAFRRLPQVWAKNFWRSFVTHTHDNFGVFILTREQGTERKREREEEKEGRIEQSGQEEERRKETTKHLCVVLHVCMYSQNYGIRNASSAVNISTLTHTHTHAPNECCHCARCSPPSHILHIYVYTYTQ
jgi:hypothetical protein